MVRHAVFKYEEIVNVHLYDHRVMLKLGKIQYGGYDDELNIYGHFGNRYDGYLDNGVRGAFEISKKAGRKRKQPQKTNCTHVCGNVIHDSCRCLIDSELPILKQTRKNRTTKSMPHTRFSPI